MKKLSKIFLSLTVLGSLFFTSCKDPVFYYISNDVVSESATINGVVRSIARYTIGNDEYLVTVASNGFVYKRVFDDSAAPDEKWTKDAQKHGAWHTVGSSELPFTLHKYDYTTAKHYGHQIIKIISDSTHIYLFTVSYYNTDEGLSSPEKIHIWSVAPADSDGDGKWDTIEESDWNELTKDKTELDNALYIKENYTYSNFSAFFTNTPQKANRTAYFRAPDADDTKKNKYYKLSGTGYSEISIPSAVGSDKPAEEVAVKGAAYFGGVKFFTTSAVVTDETKDTAANKIYWAEGRNLCYGDLETPEKFEMKHQISALTVCSDAVLIGLGEHNNSSSSCSGGIEKLQIDSTGNLELELGKFTTNAQTQLLSSYMLSILFNTDPSQSELESSLYAGLYFVGSTASSSVSFENEGLWSYYPDRKNWNRE